jgi:hypothetical protein
MSGCVRWTIQGMTTLRRKASQTKRTHISLDQLSGAQAFQPATRAVKTLGGRIPAIQTEKCKWRFQIQMNGVEDR